MKLNLILLTLVTVVLLISCGGGSHNSDNGSGDNNNTSDLPNIAGHWELAEPCLDKDWKPAIHYFHWDITQTGNTIIVTSTELAGTFKFTHSGLNFTISQTYGPDWSPEYGYYTGIFSSDGTQITNGIIDHNPKDTFTGVKK